MRRNILQKIKKKDDAVAGIIVAILLVGLIISVLAIIQTVYVPRWMEQKESEHMNTVLDQFALLKFAIDTQALHQDANVSLSTSITLGSKEWPIFSSSRAYGTLEIIEDESNFQIMNAAADVFAQISFGKVTYASANAYFIDKTYVYETGALITGQSDGNVMSIVPNFVVRYNDDVDPKTITINFSIINTKGIGEKTSIGGYGTYPIQAQYSNSTDKQYPKAGWTIDKFSIATKYINSWEIFLKREFTKAGLEEDTDYKFTSDEKEVIVDFDDSLDITINIKKYNIGVQIAPGWVE